LDAIAVNQRQAARIDEISEDLDRLSIPAGKSSKNLGNFKLNLHALADSYRDLAEKLVSARDSTTDPLGPFISPKDEYAQLRNKLHVMLRDCGVPIENIAVIMNHDSIDANSEKMQTIINRTRTRFSLISPRTTRKKKGE
jgi:hypothetical protein